jgi:hypothetical protein
MFETEGEGVGTPNDGRVENFGSWPIAVSIQVSRSSINLTEFHSFYVSISPKPRELKLT